MWSVKMKILGIDPSLNACGVAIVNDGKLSSWGLLNSSKMEKMFDLEYADKAYCIFSQINVIRKNKKIDLICLEVPEHFGVSGYMARESGSIFKLTFLCGMLCVLPNVKIFPPRIWKGQLPKEVMRNRFVKKFPDLDIANMDHNILDSIGIGMYGYETYGKKETA